MPRWLLPEGISDVLPSEARRIEDLRRRLLDLFRLYGYELVSPPLIEYLDALLVGSGRDLAQQMFQTVDLLSGKTLAVRADMTPQVARIDAHRLNRQRVVRLCYTGSVLHTRQESLSGSREPLQAGCEIFGHRGLEADLEVMDLMVQAIMLAGDHQVQLDLSPAGIVKTLCEIKGLDPNLHDVVHALVLSKNLPQLRAQLTAIDASLAEILCEISMLYGDLSANDDAILRRAAGCLPDHALVRSVLDGLRQTAQASFWRDYPRVKLSVDFGDMRGWQYHTGISFSAYIDQHPVAVARGGRYDNVGVSFGRSRAATGFSLELRELASLAKEPEPAVAVRAPWRDDPALRAAVKALRAQGEIVVQVMPGHEDEQEEFQCDR
ncbi:MAG: ATP phosphoribosyltransferase regulatory subunit, partial [Betaproteobacteria bacterium]|nr:ATP phosphoribosyltransferase regulatory subunit [Betaproteobacteria bacterium]NDG61142.1 ATP phosphoribosyltransferase regulatory subunit [Betaproteobacteria bacterium]